MYLWLFFFNIYVVKCSYNQYVICEKRTQSQIVYIKQKYNKYEYIEVG
jgi:hypothetical protein